MKTKKNKNKSIPGCFFRYSKPYEDWLAQADRIINIKLNDRISQPYNAADMVHEIIV